MTKEQALETLFDKAENGMVDVGDVKMVFDEMNCDTDATQIPVDGVTG